MQKVYVIIYYILILLFFQIVTNIWLSYFVKNTYALNSISLVIAISVGVLIYKKNKISTKKEQLKKEEVKKIEMLKTKLLYSSNKDNANMIKQVIGSKYIIANNYMYLKNEANKEIFILMYDEWSINKSNILKALKHYGQKYDTIKIGCIENCNDEFILPEFVTNKIEILSAKDLYLKYNENVNKLLEGFIMPQIDKEKINLKRILAKMFNPNKWKMYALYGLTSLFLAKFNYSSLYFSIIASVFFVFSCICLLRKLTFKQT